jgi:hypothetical protein
MKSHANCLEDPISNISFNAYNADSELGTAFASTSPRHTVYNFRDPDT